MMEYRVVFKTLYGKKAERMDAANPLAAVNRVIRDWDDIQGIERIEAIIETEAGETTAPADFSVGKEQHITVNLSK